MRNLSLLLFLIPAFLCAQLTRVANTTLNLPADLPSPTGYALENALGSLTFNTPIAMASVPGEKDRLFVVERGGTIRVVSNLQTTPSKQLFFDLNAMLSASGEGTLATDGENGLLSMTFHPRFAENGYFYIFYSIRVNDNGSTRTFQRVARLEVYANDPASANPASHTPLISQRDDASNHNGGDLAFGPDGYLYISTGDEGGGDDAYDNARFINKDFFSAILRIDVDNLPGNLSPNPHAQTSTKFPSAVHAGAYKVPADNPFIGATMHNGQVINPNTVRTEIYATGFRNPWRFSFDYPTGRLFVADVGQNVREEIDLVVKGGNYGWSYYEANLNGPRIGSKPASGTWLAPIYDYNHGSGNYQGDSVTGGIIYRGTRLTELYETYVFADYVSGRIWSLKNSGSAWDASLLATDAGITSIGTDPRDGESIFVDIGAGQLKRLVRNGTSGTQPPALLSQTGAFSSLVTLSPAAGIVPYQPNVNFWSDYALKSRWVSVPGLVSKINYSETGNWTFPTGTVWVKHFDLETERGNPTTARRLETRFLVKTASATYGLSYKWRADQTDADLVPEAGVDAVMSVTVNGAAISQTWRYPSRNECRACHTTVAGHALSFNTRQLNREHNYGTQTLNQLTALGEAGYLDTTVPNPGALPAYAAASDTDASLEWRVRSYLATNCISCHQPGGAALGNWDARSTTPTDSANLINGLLQATGTDSANRFIVPGDAAHSVLLKRLRGDAGTPRMPPLASNEIDTEALVLIAAWIAELPQRQSFAQWQSVHFGSPEMPDAGPDADPDNDGQSNRLEFLLKTNPLISTPAFPIQFAKSDEGFSYSFIQPANRAFLIETSTDLQLWSPWSTEGNYLFYPATDLARTLQGTLLQPAQFFRTRVEIP
ncbi:MAG: PQQ-dependent sugar dehydrogenase [Verrucomicrobiota bacterium]|nr:PQQ-dependent sugar dehydrogenase [Verrucomicrobiota bacterium]